MKSFLVGNDISVRWKITDCKGDPVGLENRNLRLFIIDRGGSAEVGEFSVIGNTLFFTHYGKDQEYTGIVSLRLVENLGEKGMKTIGECRAYNITGDSCCATGGFCDGLAAELTSEVLTGIPGYSAYEVACMNGFKGTEEEWLASLKGEKGDTPIKGEDYFTPEDIASLKIPKKVSELENDSKYTTESQLSESEKAQKLYADSVASEKIKEHNESESAHPFLKGLIDGKVDRKSGYGLSKNDFTDLLKAKLESLQNYDDSEVRSLVAEIQKELDTLVEGDTQGVIDSFNEMEAFLQGITETETLTGLLEQLKTSLEEQISQKVDKEAGKGLSSNDYTDEEKVKLAGLENYDDTEVRGLIENNKSDILEHDSQIEELRSTKQSVFKTNGLTEFLSGLDNNTAHQMSDEEIESIFGSAENLRSLIQDRPIIEDTFSANQSGISTYIPLQLVSVPDEGVEGVVYEGNNIALTSNWDDPFFVSLYSNAGVYYISRLKSHIYVLPGDIDTLTKYSTSNDIKKVLGDIDELMKRIDEYTGLLLI